MYSIPPVPAMLVSGICVGTNVCEINIEIEGKKQFASVLKIMTGNEGCAIMPPMGALSHLKGWLPKMEAPGYFRHPTSIKHQWKPLDIWCLNSI